MGYYTDPQHPQIRNFTPDTTKDTLYIQASDGYGPTLAELVERAREHFGEAVDLDHLEIEAQHIHTRCLTYDQYDAGDYDDFIVVTLKTQ